MNRYCFVYHVYLFFIVFFSLNSCTLYYADFKNAICFGGRINFLSYKNNVSDRPVKYRMNIFGIVISEC